jgi:hypothetical protein
MLLLVLLVLMCALGFVMYFTAKDPRVQHVGDVLFWISLFILMWIVFVGHAALPYGR